MSEETKVLDNLSNVKDFIAKHRLVEDLVERQDAPRQESDEDVAHKQHLAGLRSLLERIPLTPEGITVAEAKRGIDAALAEELPLLVFSFHSPSLHPGNTPYVRHEEDLARFYNWWREIFAYLAQQGVRPTSISAITDAVQR